MTDDSVTNTVDQDKPKQGESVSRRRMLGGLAVGAAALGVPSVAAAQAGGPGRGVDPETRGQ